MNPLLPPPRQPRHRLEGRRDRANPLSKEARSLEPSDFFGEGLHRDASTFREHRAISGEHRSVMPARRRLQ